MYMVRKSGKDSLVAIEDDLKDVDMTKQSYFVILENVVFYELYAVGGRFVECTILI